MELKFKVYRMKKGAKTVRTLPVILPKHDFVIVGSYKTEMMYEPIYLIHDLIDGCIIVEDYNDLISGKDIRSSAYSISKPDFDKNLYKVINNEHKIDVPERLLPYKWMVEDIERLNR